MSTPNLSDDAYVILNDRETYTNLAGCHLAVVDTTRKTHRLIVYDLAKFLAVYADQLSEYRVLLSDGIKDTIQEELLEP